jgi:dolichyl-phosphate beta-glucosyltransferase
MSSTQRTVVVVPCYDEEERLDASELRRLSETADVWLVDDGSRDRTRQRIETIVAGTDGRMVAFANQRNLGKAETVRRHLAEACERGAPIVGFLDADLATPVDEIVAMIRLLERTDAAGITAARVGLSGRDIRRSTARHYFGRVFSTFASVAIHARYYDTQCGAKVFRNTEALRTALAEPFLSRWAFDVELIGRLLAGTPDVARIAGDDLVEYPLAKWHDIAGSKLSMGAAWKTVVELVAIGRDLHRRRRRTG